MSSQEKVIKMNYQRVSKSISKKNEMTKLQK